MSNKLEALLDTVVDKKPADFREIFEELMVEKMRDIVDVYKDIVAENMFLDEDEEELDEDEEYDEDEEQLDEVSKKKLGRYVNKAAPEAVAKAMNHVDYHNFIKGGGKHDDYMHDEYKRDWHKVKNRLRGIKKATDRLTKEEEEQLDEISREAKDEYLKRARSDRYWSGRTANADPGKNHPNPDAYKAIWKDRVRRRSRGIKIANKGK